MNYLDAHSLSLIFAGLTALSILLYAILDGYDLGVGLTLPLKNEVWSDTAIASIGPFWDANETWLVLGVGLLLVAFPAAHSAILQVFYLPASLLLLGLILRGVSFDFRAKVHPKNKKHWDITFVVGSYIATSMQGFMLGIYIMGLEYTFTSIVFGIFSALCVTAAYALIGNTWLILKTTGDLQAHAIKNAKRAGVLTFMGILSVCLVNPLVNANVFQVWTTAPFAYFYAAIPIICFAMFVFGYRALSRLSRLSGDAKSQAVTSRYDWQPFAMAIIIFVGCFIGLALSFYPFVVPNELTIYEAASAPESLRIILIGAVVVIPVIALYSAFVYYAFRGKTQGLKYY
ncbi:cytochrome d ubiquinol oxidase subunit II [Ningiella sp. W23]|uniref:cytochrome d ubiquinol oxidase subunit II n=1 Tax=Ningiella sp. W23 TaxID=3023715 RepID=UPI0037571D85